MSDPLLDLVDKPSPVPVDGLPGVFVRETAFADVMAYADNLHTANNDRTKFVDANVRLIIASVCDESGRPKYTEADAEKLAKLPRKAMNTLMRAISTLNGLDAKSVEAEAKNS